MINAIKKQKNYFEHEGRAVEANENFKHVMAVALNPTTDYVGGVIRCITRRDGDVAISGFTDRSELHTLKADLPGHFVIGEILNIKNETEVIEKLKNQEGFVDYLGLEDPDIFFEEDSQLIHLYFTLPFVHPERKKNSIYLGHAVGKDLHSFEMTEPVLVTDKNGDGAKELSIAPLNKKGFRYNLIEWSKQENHVSYSVVRIAIARNMGKDWEFGKFVFHPKEHDISWIAGHASPGPFLPKSFIDLGERKMLGIINGREANKKVDGKTLHGTFSIGLFIYDFEEGKIEWVSEEPLIRDSKARTITFASQFVETELGKGISYAHVDDSFVRIYDLDAEKIQSLLPH